MSKTILSVQGMSCQGVANIAVQLDQGLVAVEHDAGVRVDRLPDRSIGALQCAGYEATPRRPS